MTTHLSRRRGRRTAATDDGAVTLFLVVAALSLLTMVGLVVDGGQLLRANQQANNTAAEAARAAAQSINPAVTVHGFAPQLDPVAAVSAGQQYLQAAGMTGTVTVTGNQVQITTVTTVTPVFVSLLGFGPHPVTGQGAARLARGVIQEER